MWPADRQMVNSPKLLQRDCVREVKMRVQSGLARYSTFRAVFLSPPLASTRSYTPCNLLGL